MEGRPLEDRELTRRAKRGDLDAFEALVRLHQQAAYRLAFVVTGSAHDADDVAQEAFMSAYLALGRFRDDAPFRPWLLRIVANAAKNHRRSSYRRQRRELMLIDDRRSGEAALSPESAVLQREDQHRLMGAVNHLPERLRIVVATRFFMGLSVAETAEVLRLPPGTVKSRLSRALDRLRADLERGSKPALGEEGHRG